MASNPNFISAICSHQQRWIKLILMLILSILLWGSKSVVESLNISNYSAIFSFGDSLADTGNLYFTSQPFHCFLPPYGQTYFGKPTGRCADGRLIIDFFAESLGLPPVKPYIGIKSGKVENSSIEKGVNFAVIGATALDIDFSRDKALVHHVPTNDSLRVQLGWFNELLPSLCNSPTSCRRLLGSSVFLMGEIGGNDFSYQFFGKRSFEEIKSSVPLVIEAITSAIKELIDMGAVTLIVPGNLPIGCSSAYLTTYQTQIAEEYDEFVCLKWLNEFARCYNGQLQAELNQLRALYPHTNIIFGDYYYASLPLYQTPNQFGFTGGALKACCGGGGPYNFNFSAECGNPMTVACDNPSKYVSWDGIHLTEAAYRFIHQRFIRQTSHSLSYN